MAVRKKPMENEIAHGEGVDSGSPCLFFFIFFTNPVHGFGFWGMHAVLSSPALSLGWEDIHPNPSQKSWPWVRKQASGTLLMGFFFWISILSFLQGKKEMVENNEVTVKEVTTVIPLGSNKKKIFQQGECSWLNPEELIFGHWAARKFPEKGKCHQYARQIIWTLIYFTYSFYLYSHAHVTTRRKGNKKEKKWTWKWKVEFLSQNTSKMGGKDWQGKQYLTAWQKIWFLSHGKF